MAAIEAELKAFGQRQLEAIPARELAETTIGVVTACVFFSGALAEIARGVGVDQRRRLLSGYMATLLGLGPTNAAGLVASGERLAARYRHLDNAYRAGAAALQECRRGEPAADQRLREFIHRHRQLSMAELSVAGIKAGPGAAPTSTVAGPDPASAAPVGHGRGRRRLFWLVVAAIVVILNITIVLWLNRG